MLPCPICNGEINESEYLRHVFLDDDYAYWVACFVTHTRHQHVRYYDRSWKVPAYAEKNPEYADGHEAFKAKVNNRAKRNLIRALVKSRTVKDQDKINLIKAVIKMQHNDKETLILRRKMLDKLRHKTNSRYEKSYNPKEYELVYVGNDVNLLAEVDKKYAVEFELFENRIRQARIDEPVGVKR